MKWTKTPPRTEGWYFWRFDMTSYAWPLHVYADKNGRWKAEWVEDHRREVCLISDLEGSFWRAHKP